MVQRLRRLQPLPGPALTADEGGAVPPLHPGLARLAFLLGTWRGEGVASSPDGGPDHRFGQEVSFSHAGTPVLAYASRTWALADDPTGTATGTPLAAETGWWRPQPDGSVELLLAHPTGYVEIYVGSVTGAKIELQTDAVVRTSSAERQVTAGHRLYGLVEGELMYAVDSATEGGAGGGGAAGSSGLTPERSGRLTRTAAG